MMTRVMIRTTLTGAAVLSLMLLGTTGFASQQNPPVAQTPAQAGQPHQHDHAAVTADAQAGTMMARHQEMMASMQAMDSRLAELTTAMKAATGADKITAMEAVLNELLAQRSAMHGRMMDMEADTMGHMMGGMRTDGGAPGCPMMTTKEPRK